jgi:hypothetical protein
MFLAERGLPWPNLPFVDDGIRMTSNGSISTHSNTLWKHTLHRRASCRRNRFPHIDPWVEESRSCRQGTWGQHPWPIWHRNGSRICRKTWSTNDTPLSHKWGTRYGHVRELDGRTRLVIAIHRNMTLVILQSTSPRETQGACDQHARILFLK